MAIKLKKRPEGHAETRIPSMQEKDLPSPEEPKVSANSKGKEEIRVEFEQAQEMPSTPEDREDNTQSLPEESPEPGKTHRFVANPAHPEKLPLIREKPSAEPFPVEALGPLMCAAAKAIHHAVQAPLAICAQSVVAAMTLGVQAHADIEIDGRTTPISEFFLTIAESGERKTAVDKICLRPIQKLESEEAAGYAEARRIYELEMEVYQKGIKDIAKIADPLERREALRSLDPPEAPFMPILTIDDPTVEGLAKFFRESRPRLGMFSDEAGRFLGGYGMLKDNQLKTAANLSKLWDGGAVRSVRSKAGFVTIEGKRLTAHLMVQPEPAADFLGNSTMENQGLFSRILISHPESTIGQRASRSESNQGTQAITRFQDYLYRVLKEPLPTREGNPRYLSPRKLQLSAEAYGQFIMFHDEVEAELGDGGKFAGIRGFANKAPEHASRLAAILALADDLGVAELASEKMEAGIVLARFYLGEALRQVSSASVHPSLVLAQKALNWARGNSDENHFSTVDLYQKGPMAIRNKEKAMQILKILEDHRYIRKIHGGMILHGRKRQDVFQLL